MTGLRASSTHLKARLAPGAILLSVLFLVAAMTACSSERDAKAAHPNVLLIVLDTTRADFLSAYGFHAPTTPFIDGLAQTGTRYENAYSTSHWTLPGHASLFTGLYPTEAQATTETRHLPQSVVTIAEKLRDAGYRTRAAVANPWISIERGFDQGFEEFVETWRPPKPRPPLFEPIGWIREFAASGDPFLIFLNFNTPHLPYDPVPKQRRLFVAADRPEEEVDRLSGFEDVYAHLAGKIDLAAEDFQTLRELYSAEIHVADAFVGHIVSSLESAGLLDSTLIVVLSDHGENIGEHGQIGHTLGLYETLVRVPLVIRYPARFKQGAVDTDLQSLIDIMPTILDVCGVADPESEALIRERSLGNSNRQAREHVFAEANRPVMVIDQLSQHFPDFDTSAIDHRIVAIRDERYKLVWNVGREAEIFDLEGDPGETTNLAGELPWVEGRLHDVLERWMETLRAVEPAEPLESSDPETLERLRALGYIQ